MLSELLRQLAFALVDVFVLFDLVLRFGLLLRLVLRPLSSAGFFKACTVFVVALHGTAHSEGQRC
jgi:hypothetical protein